ncbi:MAG TPA: DegT/DnrJ/EryC1/StrS family aminotransferase [Terriglobia bacterium]
MPTAVMSNARVPPMRGKKIPQFDLKRQQASLETEIRAVLDRVCRSASFILGEEVERFEQEFAAYVEAKHCVAVNSGTSALHLALLAAGVGPGDEVITTANTFIATAEAISYTGATPVFVDTNPATANIDPKRVERAVTPRTRAILPVHLYGRPADLGPILDLARNMRTPSGPSGKPLAVIEDACQAHGARYQGRQVGALGFAGAFSFYPTKNLSAYGEGGALVTNDDEVAALARSLRTHGESHRYFHDRIGYNYRMEGFQGAVLRVKLKRLPEWTARRQEIARRYRQLLAGSPVTVLLDRPGDECVFHQFAVNVSDRDRVRAGLESQGVSTAIFYPRPIHLQAPYRSSKFPAGSLPETERACERVLCLPLFPELTDAEVAYTGQTLAGLIKANDERAQDDRGLIA